MQSAPLPASPRIPAFAENTGRGVISMQPMQSMQSFRMAYYRRFLQLIIASSLLMISSCSEKIDVADVNIVPEPSRVSVARGYFTLDAKTKVLYTPGNPGFAQVAELAAERMNLVTGLTIQAEESASGASNAIIIAEYKNMLDQSGPEGYRLFVDANKIRIEAGSPAGAFYGLQTLWQLMPVEIYNGERVTSQVEWKVPVVEIYDKPQYSWRGMHLDVSRHFFPVEFVKKYIDLIAMHKMNTFHWHLTDDNGWRIEIKKYPLLTEIAGWRVDREHLPWAQRPLQQPGETATYGGFYTQEEIKEVVEYAAARHVTIIPEIEMPGHTSEVFTAYPQFSCSGEKVTVHPGSYWPITNIFCAGKEETFTFLEDVLTEVAGLFPSEYIHIGGDEADKTEWKRCPLCQKRIREEGLKDENELQSYFVKRIERFLNSKGKKLIGWDEILEGGLAPEATVMSWRGVDGGIEAARQGHDVIMCPTSHCYFDYYQADPDFEPLAIGGFTTLRKVYSFEPIPPILTAEEAKHILGAQGNVWTEYIAKPEHVEYMAVPRMAALAEVVWSHPAERDWDNFIYRMQEQYQRYEQMNVNYSKGSYKVSMVPEISSDGTYFLKLESEIYNATIRYTLDGSLPTAVSTLYTASIPVTGDIMISAAIFENDSLMEKPAEHKVNFHKAVGKKVQYLTEPSFKYPGDSPYTLTDGMMGSLKHNDGLWQGFQDEKVEFVIDLGTSMDVKSIGINCLQNQNPWIFLPLMVEFQGSDDGSLFKEIGQSSLECSKNDEVKCHRFEVDLASPLKYRYLKVSIQTIGKVPEWHWGAGGNAWIFIDEVTVF